MQEKIKSITLLQYTYCFMEANYRLKLLVAKYDLESELYMMVGGHETTFSFFKKYTLLLSASTIFIITIGSTEA